jgi:hypothetical protein
MDGNKGKNEAANGAEAVEKVVEMMSGSQNSRDEHEDNVAGGSEVPGAEGGGVVEDFGAVLREDLREQEDEETGGETSHGEVGVGDEGVGKFDVFENAGKEAGESIEDEDGEPDKEGPLPARTGIFPVLAGVIEGEEDGPDEEGAEAGDLAGVVVGGWEGFGEDSEGEIEDEEGPEFAFERGRFGRMAEGAGD